MPHNLSACNILNSVLNVSENKINKNGNDNTCPGSSPEAFPHVCRPSATDQSEDDASQLLQNPEYYPDFGFQVVSQRLRGRRLRANFNSCTEEKVNESSKNIKNSKNH